MKRDFHNTCVNFASRISNDELRFLGIRFYERVAHDLADALNFLEQKPEIDFIFSSTLTNKEVYDYCDDLTEILMREVNRRQLEFYPETASDIEIYNLSKFS